VARRHRRARAVEVTSDVQWSRPSEDARDALDYLSSCENGFIVSQVQGVFANALSVLKLVDIWPRQATGCWHGGSGRGAGTQLDDACPWVAVFPATSP